MRSSGRCRPNYDLLRKEALYSRFPEFAGTAKLAGGVLSCQTKRHYFKYKPRARPAAKRASLWYYPCSTTPNLISLPGLGLKIVRSSQPCASAWRSGEVWNHLAIRSFKQLSLRRLQLNDEYRK